MSKGAAATALPSATTGDDCPAALSRQQLAHRLHRVRVALHVSAMPHNFGRSELAHRNFGDRLLREEDEDEARAPDLAAAAAAPLPEADADPEPPLVEMSIALLLPCA
ncbi:hypothetical protein CRG98_009498 [Punica granatum]|uniref:Uncharacterized protein n=1 Tax=Punica granatum TaxID=22663 RepID=A0A2I0KNH2_PUNGR|nr:hypothetical protein CRG98_009498 [Punica granatum]